VAGASTRCVLVCLALAAGVAGGAAANGAQPIDPPRELWAAFPFNPGAPEANPFRLMNPGPGERVVAGRRLLVSWRPRARASYYNLQIYRGQRKLLSRFPARHWLVVAGGRLRPGSYRLVVWVGLGPKFLGSYAQRPWVDRPLTVRSR
jgi:hypothetical protein